MVFDFDLNLKEVVQTDYYMDEMVADGRFIYGIRTLYRDETGFELVVLEQDRLQDTPRVLLSSTGGVPGRRTTGKSLMQAVDGAYVSFPFDTHVYKSGMRKSWKPIIWILVKKGLSRTPSGTA